MFLSEDVDTVRWREFTNLRGALEPLHLLLLAHCLQPYPWSQIIRILGWLVVIVS